jgi:hypothetical protein
METALTITETWTTEKALAWKERVGNAATSLRQLLWEGYEAQAWSALGYATWTECVKAIADEYGISERNMWRLHSGNQTEALLTPGSVGEIPEKQLRPLTSLPPPQQAEAWQRAVETAPEGKVTAAHVQTVVTEMQGGNVYQPIAATVFSFKSEEYDTPGYLLEVARSVLGGFDLDPASNESAQHTVGAATYYTKEQDGLSQPWAGRLWLNPPYGKTAGKSNQELWAQRLIAEYKAGNVTAAILLVKAAVGYRWFEELFRDWPVCFLRERLSFILDSGDDDGQSKQGTALFYFGPDFMRFAQAFRGMGRIIPPEAQLNATLFG